MLQLPLISLSKPSIYRFWNLRGFDFRRSALDYHPRLRVLVFEESSHQLVARRFPTGLAVVILLDDLLLCVKRQAAAASILPPNMMRGFLGVVDRAKRITFRTAHHFSTLLSL